MSSHVRLFVKRLLNQFCLPGFNDEVWFTTLQMYFVFVFVKRLYCSRQKNHSAVSKNQSRKTVSFVDMPLVDSDKTKQNKQNRKQDFPRRRLCNSSCSQNLTWFVRRRIGKTTTTAMRRVAVHNEETCRQKSETSDSSLDNVSLQEPRNSRLAPKPDKYNTKTKAQIRQQEKLIRAPSDTIECDISTYAPNVDRFQPNKLKLIKTKSRGDMITMKYGFELPNVGDMILSKYEHPQSNNNHKLEEEMTTMQQSKSQERNIHIKQRLLTETKENGIMRSQSGGLAFEHHHLQRYSRAYRDVIERVKAAMKIRYNGMLLRLPNAKEIKRKQLCYDCATNAHKEYTIAGLDPNIQFHGILNASCGFNQSCPIVQTINCRFHDLRLNNCVSISEKADKMEKVLNLVLKDMYSKTYLNRGQLKSETYHTVL
ncbi:uncharacterized protein LOC100181261 [Ciona intestinalis]